MTSKTLATYKRIKRTNPLNKTALPSRKHDDLIFLGARRETQRKVEDFGQGVQRILSNTENKEEDK